MLQVERKLIYVCIMKLIKHYRVWEAAVVVLLMGVIYEVCYKLEGCGFDSR
jgi:hypothetical protein